MIFSSSFPSLIVAALSFTSVNAIPLDPLESSTRQSLAIRQDKSGIQLDSSCSAGLAKNITAAISALADLSGAALDAITYPNQIPYSEFFSANDASKVHEIIQSVNSVALGSGPSVTIRCDDVDGRCATNGPGSGALAYAILSAADASNSFINICSAYSYPKVPDPCAINALTTISLADTLLHELTHILTYTSDQLQVKDYAYGAGPAAALEKQPDTTQALTNADNYVFLSRWAWLALYGIGRPNSPCRTTFMWMSPRANLTQLPAALTASPTPTTSASAQYASGVSSSPIPRVSVPAQYANGDFSKRSPL